MVFLNVAFGSVRGNFLFLFFKFGNRASPKKKSGQTSLMLIDPMGQIWPDFFRLIKLEPSLALISG